MGTLVTENLLMVSRRSVGKVEAILIANGLRQFSCDVFGLALDLLSLKVRDRGPLLSLSESFGKESVVTAREANKLGLSCQ